MVLILATLVLIFYSTLNFIRWIFAKKELSEDLGCEASWFGKELKVEGHQDDTSIRPFRVEIPNEVLEDLKSRLSRSRFEDPLEDSRFNNGFNSRYLQEVVEYWSSEYDWRREEAKLNTFPHFKTSIEGVDVHFVHVKPNLGSHSEVKVLPLLMVHGWPGSFVEFCKIIPLLTTPRHGHVFEIVCPSIPGYGFSESPHRKGFNQRAAARVFVTLMGRLGYSSFYAQGGDWGALITQIIAKYYPYKVRGLHVNMFSSMPKSTLGVLKMILVAYCPFLVPKDEYTALYPLKEKAGMLLQESGYFHIQATKPDTIGSALSDSPVGLAAYILEKFSTWTDRANVVSSDGGLTLKFTLDELLTNVMIYWVNNNVTSSVRFYKEFCIDPDRQKHEDKPIEPPTGIALFPNELLGAPKMLIPKIVKNLVSYSKMPRGGHFAAFEEPQLLADDIWKFIELVEKK